MCSCSDNAPSCTRTVVRRAVREHRCFECGRTIPKGDLYQITSGIWDGEPEAFKWCDTCTTIANLLEGMSREDERAARLRGELVEGFCFTYGDLLACAEEFLREFR